MDCDRALEALSEAIDLGADNVPDHAEALAHCAGCPDCSRAAAGMRRLEAIPGPQAPPRLVDHVLEAVVDERAAAEAVAAAGDLGGVVPLPPPKPRTSPFRTAVLVAAGAAALVGAFFVMRAGIVSITGGARDGLTVSVAPVGSKGESVPPAPLPEGFRGDVTSGAEATALKAPDYIAFDGRVYRAAPGVTPPERSTLTTLGETTTDLGTGVSEAHAVLGLPGAPQSVYVAKADGAIELFAIVTRTRGGARFALQSDAAIARFGDWPKLPARFPAPTASDGGPTFRADATPDDVGVKVYPLPGGDPAQGFAIAPNMAATDPGSGNPNWTWWAPAP